jgi:two-component system response regulator TctD
MTPILFLLLKTHQGVFRHEPAISRATKGAIVTSRNGILISEAFVNLSTTFQEAFSRSIADQMAPFPARRTFTDDGAPVNSAHKMLTGEKSMRVLLVEDHLQLAESVALALKSSGLTVDVLHDGVAADLALSSEEYAVVVLDVGLPRMDGFEVLARLRARGKNTPVLMLTARSDVKDRVHGLNLGADDYLAKPFELSELEARVKALLRRSVLGGERQQRCGELIYDLDTRRFTLGEELLTLTSREQSVLESLIARPGRVMSKEQLAAQVFGLDEEASPDAIEIYVHRLRKKLDGHPIAIVTFRGLGYLLESRDA